MPILVYLVVMAKKQRELPNLAPTPPFADASPEEMQRWVAAYQEWVRTTEGAKE